MEQRSGSRKRESLDTQNLKSVLKVLRESEVNEHKKTNEKNNSFLSQESLHTSEIYTFRQKPLVRVHFRMLLAKPVNFSNYNLERIRDEARKWV